MAGMVILAALVTGINSDLPGEVIAAVTETVYDSATGRYPLVPPGSRIMGRPDSLVSYGQSRVQVVSNPCEEYMCWDNFEKAAAGRVKFISSNQP